MKTVARYIPGFVAANTRKSVKQIPPGKLWMTLVTVEVVELEELNDKTNFILFAAVPDEQEDPIKGSLLRMAGREIYKCI